MSTSTSKLIILLFLPVLTAEKCTGSKNGNLKRDASTIAPSKMAAAADAIPLTDLATTEAQPDRQEKEKEKEDKKDQVIKEVKVVPPSVQETKNIKTTQKDQSWKEEHAFKTEEDKQYRDSNNREAGSEPTNDDVCNPDNITQRNSSKKQEKKVWFKNLLRRQKNNKT
ncbi:protein of unknown function [Cardinium endosymbiont cEper1 of Encarsia pergandiella]|uniref:hypothetical protein n=1 Tax=Cardinium endosymbiont of Encarsia pergandiella TaxID=249402 RepID=UPI00027EAA18|nr:hypothetical protein [Cardinium endosymbiont of Encarsia pergandiella]CCM10486.1 protein of unknown function [Cardinium endosymbiont cEper1 of Encarsia pergandiella]